MQIIRLEVGRITIASLPEYDKQFRLKTSANSSISWASVDAELWLIYMLNQSLTQQTQSNLNCYDYSNFKCSCSRQPCLNQHSYIHCHKTTHKYRYIAGNCSHHTQSTPGRTPINQSNQITLPFVPTCTNTPSVHAISIHKTMIYGAQVHLQLRLTFCKTTQHFTLTKTQQCSF